MRVSFCPDPVVSWLARLSVSQVGEVELAEKPATRMSAEITNRRMRAILNSRFWEELELCYRPCQSFQHPILSTHSSYSQPTYEPWGCRALAPSSRAATSCPENRRQGTAPCLLFSYFDERVTATAALGVEVGLGVAVAIACGVSEASAATVAVA